MVAGFPEYDGDHDTSTVGLRARTMAGSGGVIATTLPPARNDSAPAQPAATASRAPTGEGSVGPPERAN